MYIDLKVFVSKSEIFARFTFSQCMNKQTKLKEKKINELIFTHTHKQHEKKQFITFFFFNKAVSKEDESKYKKKKVYVFNGQ